MRLHYSDLGTLAFGEVFDALAKQSEDWRVCFRVRLADLMFLKQCGYALCVTDSSDGDDVICPSDVVYWYRGKLGDTSGMVLWMMKDLVGDVLFDYGIQAVEVRRGLRVSFVKGDSEIAFCHVFSVDEEGKDYWCALCVFRFDERGGITGVGKRGFGKRVLKALARRFDGQLIKL